jgi:hypothetical protein
MTGSVIERTVNIPEGTDIAKVTFRFSAIGLAVWDPILERVTSDYLSKGELRADTTYNILSRRATETDFFLINYGD